MTSVSTILESVGINYGDLASQVAEAKRAPRNTEPAGVTVEALACAVEQLASRLAGIAEDVSGSIGDYYVGDMAEDVIGMVNNGGGKDALELIRTHLNLDAPEALLSSSPVFGHPDLRCVNHTVPDHTKGTLMLTSYLVNVQSGEVTPIPGGPTTADATALART